MTFVYSYYFSLKPSTDKYSFILPKYSESVIKVILALKYLKEVNSNKL